MASDDTLEAERAGIELYEGWSTAYNGVDGAGHQSLLALPHVSFGGARPTRDALALAVRRDSYGGVQERVTYRDRGWGHSSHDNVRSVQLTPDKSHLIADIVRYEENGAPYGVGWSRLQVAFRDEQGWRIRVLSSSGLRDPEDPDEPDDAQISERAESIVRSAVEAINNGDVEALRAVCNFPFVRIPGAMFEVIDEPSELQPAPANDGWHTSEITKLRVYPPQSGDKVVVEVDVKRSDANGEELPSEGAVCLVTRQEGQWGLQMCSTRTGLPGIP